MTSEARGKQEVKTERFLCPYPGCKRSFIDLWRLKVHYRADPDVRGSGRERGHGKELPACPKCKKRLERGRHHVNCAAGKAAPSQANRRFRGLSCARTEYNSSTSDNENWFGTHPIKSEVPQNCFLPPECFEPEMLPMGNLGPGSTVQLSSSMFPPSAPLSRVDCRRESLTASALPDGWVPALRYVLDINVTPGYAVFLRSHSMENPRVYFVPGETVEVSVEDPAFQAQQSNNY